MDVDEPIKRTLEPVGDYVREIVMAQIPTMNVPMMTV
jgi:hypothetical protein